MAGGVASETVQMALSRSSRTFEKTSQRQAVPMGTPWTSLPVTDSTPREASEGNYEMYQTMVFLAKNLLHPQFHGAVPRKHWRCARSPWQAHRAGYAALGGPESQKSSIFSASSHKTVPGFWVPSPMCSPPKPGALQDCLGELARRWKKGPTPRGARGHILAMNSLPEGTELCQDSTNHLSLSFPLVKSQSRCHVS